MNEQNLRVSMDRTLYISTKKQLIQQAQQDQIVQDLLQISLFPYINKVQLQLSYKNTIAFNKIIKKLSNQVRFLTVLFLKKNKLSDRTVQLICEAKWKFITDLDLLNTGITDEALCKFPQAEWSYLKILNLSNNKLGNKSTKYLAKCQFKMLEYFYFNETSFTYEGFKNIQKMDLPNIKFMSFCEAQLHYVDLKFLARTNWFKLQRLDLHIDKRYKTYIWCSQMAKLPPQLKDLDISVFAHQTQCNTKETILNLCHFYEFANKLDYEWQIFMGILNDREQDDNQ